MKFKTISLSLFFVFIPMVYSQTFFGLQNSNYGGVHSIYSNPGSLALMPYKRQANVSSFGFNVNNNAVSLETPFTFWQLITNQVDNQYKDANGRILWKKNWIKETGTEQNLWANIGLEYRGPSYAHRIGEKLVWASATRTRTSVVFSDFSPAMLQWAKLFMDSSKSIQNFTNIAQTPFKISANAYQEFSGSLSYKIKDDKNLKIGVGITGKLLLGLGSFNLSNGGSQIQSFGADSIRLNYSNLSVSYTDFSFFNQILKGVLLGSMPKLSQINGIGLGADFGFAVEIGSVDRTSTEVQKMKIRRKNYRFKFGLSVLDFGKIKFNGQGSGFSIKNATPVSLNFRDPNFILAATQGSNSVFDYVKQFAKDKGVYQDLNQPITVELPTVIQIQADYKIVRFISVGGQWQQRLQSIQNHQFISQSSLVLVPRFEARWFEFSVPVSFYDDYKQAGLGFYTRLGPVFIGSDNILKNLNASKYSGINLYFGFSSLIP